MTTTVNGVRPDLPVGTVTFLRTDVEGSMGLAQRLGSRWDDINARHIACIRRAVETGDGRIVRTEGDAVFAVFSEAGAAVRAAIDAQRALAGEAWPEGADVRVRIGLHTGEAHLAGDDYGGIDVNRAARVAAAGHGGQILLSEATRMLVLEALPDDVTLIDLGSHVLRDLPRPERLAQLSIPGLRSSFPPPRSEGSVPGNLPDRLTSFVGRTADLEMVREILTRGRLVTLTGPGGIGKSSLAVEAARSVAGDYPDGAWFVPLAGLSDPGEVGAAIAHGIGLRDGPERSAASALAPYLGDRSALLVLDNMEHLLDAAEEVGAILRASPRTRVIVTSRAPLHVAGEHEIPVTPLREDAVDLFVARARAVRPGWDPGNDLAVIEDICRLLDDLPLGIELAAARSALLSPAVIRDRLAARLPLPGPGPRDLPARQRTLDGAVAWSHDLLPPTLQTLLHDLGVFEDGFDVDEVLAVAGPAEKGRDRLDDLLELADRSLIVVDPAGLTRPRFRMLRTIRSFALDRLARDMRLADVRRRHADAYLALATEALGHLNTFDHEEWLARMEPEVANHRAAIRSAIDSGEAVMAMRLAAVLWRFWNALGHLAEGRRYVEETLAMPGATSDAGARAWAEAAAGSVAYWQGDSASAREHYEEQVRLAKLAGDEVCLADGYFNLGHVAFIDRQSEAEQYAYIDQTEARYRDLGDERGVARAHWARGVLAIAAGRTDEAAGYLEQGRVEFERLGDRQYLAMSTASLAWTSFVQGDVSTAVPLAVESLQESLAMRDVGTTTISLHIGVLMGVMAGRYEDAAMVNGAFDALCERFGVRPPAALGRFIETADPFQAAREALDTATYEAAYERGSRMDLEQAVATVSSIAEEIMQHDAAGAGSPES